MVCSQYGQRSVQRRYMQLEGLSTVSDYQTARLSAVISG